MLTRRLTTVMLAVVLAGCQAAAPVPPAPSPRRWIPAPGATWQWQLTGRLDPAVPAEVYDVDGFTTTAADVETLHRTGRRVICYISVGSAERFRPDAARWPESVLGKPTGWAGERWVDVRDRTGIGPILAARMDMCRDKGFDGVEPDVMDGYAHDTGFPLTPADQLAFNRWVAALAHERGLSVGLKNDLEQIPALLDVFEFAVDEECVAHDECPALRPFVASGKAVFHAEYDHAPSTFCAATRALGLSSIRKDRALGPWRQTC
ncbi:endo alpha-1,4 polygalactosaminidase [Actinoplanes sp. NPDC049802]|uniref:endo alpha-1,4 polygalactosaminidase n=1 Tax=Actinoplanes sp. NPDC049802 TaxID=3154742 RepID=UPI0033F5E557